MRESALAVILILSAIFIGLSSCEKKSQTTQSDRSKVIEVNNSTEIALCETCPPGFELTEDGVCRLRSLYQQYLSLKDQGVGGLKTALPKVRDGFSPQHIDLGRYLFFDPLLSGNRDISCSTCHQLEKSLTDGLDRSIGALGTPVARSAPSLWNVAFLKLFFWSQ